MRGLSAELVKRAQHGDESAFEELVRLHQKKVYNLALRIVGNPQDAMDVSQEAFLRAFLGLSGFRGESSFGTWLYRLTVHTCGDFLRKEKKHSNNVVPLYTEDDDGKEISVDVPDMRDSPETAYEREELAAALNEALAGMPEEYRTVIVMRETGGLSYDEIGSELNLKPGTVKSRIFRAREYLRKVLTESGNFFPGEPSNLSVRR